MRNKRGDRMTNGEEEEESPCATFAIQRIAQISTAREDGDALLYLITLVLLTFSMYIGGWRGKWRCFVFGLVNQRVTWHALAWSSRAHSHFFFLSLFLLFTFLSLTLFAAASPHSPPPDSHSSTMPTLPHTLYLQLKTLSACPLENCTYCVEDSVEVRSLVQTGVNKGDVTLYTACTFRMLFFARVRNMHQFLTAELKWFILTISMGSGWQIGLTEVTNYDPDNI